MAISALAVLTLVGCGGDDERSAAPPALSDVAIVAERPADLEIGRNFVEYVSRGCGREIPERIQDRLDDRPNLRRLFEASLALCDALSEVEVEDSRIRASIDPMDAVEPVDLGRAFCMEVRGSDVADSTPGHELVDSSGDSITVCGTRNAYR